MNNKEKKQQLTEIDIIRAFEQAEAQSTNVARYAGGLYKDLIQNGIPDETAREIVKAVALKFLGAGL